MAMLEPDEDEPGPWFESLVEAPAYKICHLCGDSAELQDDDGQFWCSPCAGEHDTELSYADPDMP